MKRAVFGFLFTAIFASLALAQHNGPSLKFSKEMHDYGTVFVDSMPDTRHTIEFTNSGTSPLILSNVTACCGTQVTSWPREPITPGGKGTITIQYYLSPRPQRISRTVTVFSNSVTNPTAIFRIIGDVVER